MKIVGKSSKRDFFFVFSNAFFLLFQMMNDKMLPSLRTHQKKKPNVNEYIYQIYNLNLELSIICTTNNKFTTFAARSTRCFSLFAFSFAVVRFYIFQMMKWKIFRIFVDRETMYEKYKQPQHNTKPYTCEKIYNIKVLFSSVLQSL